MFFLSRPLFSSASLSSSYFSSFPLPYFPSVSSFSFPYFSPSLSSLPSPPRLPFIPFPEPSTIPFLLLHLPLSLPFSPSFPSLSHRHPFLHSSTGFRSPRPHTEKANNGSCHYFLSVAVVMLRVAAGDTGGYTRPILVQYFTGGAFDGPCLCGGQSGCIITFLL